MCEGHLADDRLVGRERYPGQPGDVGREGVELPGLDPGIDPVEHLERHHQFFEGGVSRPLPEAVDGDVGTGRPRPEGGDGGCEPEPEVVVAVDRERGKQERRYDRGRPLGGEEPDGVAEAEPVGAPLDPFPEDRREEILVGAGGVFAG